MRPSLLILSSALALLTACKADEPQAPPEPQAQARPATPPPAAPPAVPDEPRADPHAGLPAQPQPPAGGSPGMGFMPDYDTSGTGMGVAEVRPGGAADKAGIRAGDVITKFAGVPVRDVHDYMAALPTVKVGDKVKVELLRDGKPLTLAVEVGVSNR